MLVMGSDNKFGERAGPVDAHALRVRAQMAPAGQAIAAAAANHVAFAADNVAGIKVVDVGADRNDLADKFMADGHGNRDGLLRPLVPLVDMNVGAADAGIVDAHQHIVDADDRFGNIFQPQSTLGPALD